jgi:hypothetical protein
MYIGKGGESMTTAARGMSSVFLLPFDFESEGDY